MKNILIASLYTITIIVSEYIITNNFSILNVGLFFTVILFLTLFFESYKLIYILLFIFSAIHHLFFSYFQREITSVDIYLFFTHIEETLESFYSLFYIFYLSIILMFIGLSILFLIKKIQTKKYLWLYYFPKEYVLLTLILMNIDSNMGSKLIKSLLSLPTLYDNRVVIKSEDESPLYPIREENLNILLLVGESMKYSSFVESKLKEQKLFYKKIYSSAINTDVAIPLLINSKTNPLMLSHNNETNLFKLAKKNNFHTSFISIQTENSLRYIKPYLQKEHIDYYKSYSKKERRAYFDFLLLENLDKIDFSQKNFIVMQQVGQHSPYKFFREEVSNNAKENYIKSIEYSFKLYKEIYIKLMSTKKPFIFIYTSDHGEFTGEGGRYGHNIFDKIIYEVPMFIGSNIELQKEYKDIKSHYHIAQFITHLLGYNKILKLSKERSIVNGTMMSREDGFRVMP